MDGRDGWMEGMDEWKRRMNGRNGWMEGIDGKKRGMQR